MPLSLIISVLIFPLSFGSLQPTPTIDSLFIESVIIWQEGNEFYWILLILELLLCVCIFTLVVGHRKVASETMHKSMTKELASNNNLRMKAVLLNLFLHCADYLHTEDPIHLSHVYAAFDEMTHVRTPLYH